jgi:hypothetical protein
MICSISAVAMADMIGMINIMIASATGVTTMMSTVPTAIATALIQRRRLALPA